MNLKRKILLVNPIFPSDSVELPFLYLLLKSYYRENGVHFDKWEWLEPVEDVCLFAFSDLVKHIVANEPDVIGFSCFVWNHKLNQDLAVEVKKALPQTLIVFGGPDLALSSNPDWFVENSSVDVACQYPGRGEEFISTLLDQIASDSVEISKVPFALYPDPLDRKVKYALTEKNSIFKWPTNLFQEVDGLNINVQKHFKKSKYLATNWETTRGCPYRCTYCEWGGGTNTKVLAKPDQVIENELKYIDLLEINEVRITDANFGIFKERDINIIKRLIEISKKGNLKQVYLFGKAKNDWSISEKIDTLLLEAGLTDRDTYHLAINGTNDSILSAVRRKNVPVEVMVAKALQFKDKYNLRLKFEILMGLPESNLDSFYQELCLLDQVDDWTTERYVWSLLPGTPAADPGYVEKYRIKTSQIKFDIGGDLKSQVLKKSESHLLANSAFQSQYVIVTSTSSYSELDWAQMYFMDHFTRAMELSGFLTEIRKFFQQRLSLSAGEFYKLFWSSFEHLSGETATLVTSVKKQINSIIDGSSKNQFAYFDNPFMPNLNIRLETYFNMLYFLYYSEILRCLSLMVPSEYGPYLKDVSGKHGQAFKGRTLRELFELANQPFLNKLS